MYHEIVKFLDEEKHKTFANVCEKKCENICTESKEDIFDCFRKACFQKKLKIVLDIFSREIQAREYLFVLNMLKRAEILLPEENFKDIKLLIAFAMKNIPREERTPFYNNLLSANEDKVINTKGIKLQKTS